MVSLRRVACARVWCALLCWVGLASASVGRAQAARDTLWVHTREVRDLTEHDGMLWTATSGGVEAYVPSTGQRVRHYTQQHGLAELDIVQLRADGAELVALSAGHRCVLKQERFACSGGSAPPRPALFGGSLQGAPVTEVLTVDGSRYVATEGAGLFRTVDDREEAVSPAGQICTQQVHAMAVFMDQVWVSGFREGLCRLGPDGFEDVEAPLRMINALRVARGKLYLASGQGLYVTVDGARFERIDALEQRTVTGIVQRGRYLWATTPSALWRIPLTSRGTLGSFWRPGGSRSLQAIAVSGHDIWLASEDRGLIRFRDGKGEAFDLLRGLPSSWMLDVAADAKGRIYGASLRDGVVVLEPGTGEPRVRQAFADAWPMRVVARREGAWVATQSGLRGWPDDAAPDLTQIRASVHQVMEADGHLWVGSEAGLWMHPL